VVVSKTSSSPPTTSFVSFVSSVIPYCGTKTVAVGCLHHVLLAISGALNLVSAEYLIGFSDTVQPFLTSVVPSLYLSGLRMAEEATVSAPVERLIVGMRVSLDRNSEAGIAEGPPGPWS
jgi:hypothetical protein